jgi:hypothetical protein
MSQDRPFEFPSDVLELMNARLDFEYEADRAQILYTDAVGRDRCLLWGGRIPSRVIQRGPR